MNAQSDLVPIPRIGGIFKDDSGTLIPFVGTDPDAETNCWSWDQTAQKWLIAQDTFQTTWQNMKGPVHAGQFHPTSVKEQLKTKEACVKFEGTRMSNPEEKGNTTSLKTYKDQCRAHMIKHGLWDVFYIPDPKNSAVKWDLFRHLGKFPLTYVVTYVETLRSTADQYALHNLDWSGEFLRNSLNSDLLTKVLKLVDISASGPEVLSATLTVIHSSNYEIMEKVRNQLANIRLSNFPGENVDDCCTAMLKLTERMADAGFLRPEHLSMLTRCWKQSKDHHFELWAIRKHEQVNAYRRKLEVMEEAAIPAAERVDYETLIKEAHQEYRELVEQGEWGPTGKGQSVEEPTLPTAYAAMIQKAVSDSVTKAMGSSGRTLHPSGILCTPSDTQRTVTFSGNCHSCGKVGHMRKDCPG